MFVLINISIEGLYPPELKICIKIGRESYRSLDVKPVHIKFILILSYLALIQTQEGLELVMPEYPKTFTVTDA